MYRRARRHGDIDDLVLGELLIQSQHFRFEKDNGKLIARQGELFPVAAV